MRKGDMELLPKELLDTLPDSPSPEDKLIYRLVSRRNPWILIAFATWATVVLLAISCWAGLSSIAGFGYNPFHHSMHNMHHGMMMPNGSLSTSADDLMNDIPCVPWREGSDPPDPITVPFNSSLQALCFIAAATSHFSATF
jgi:hypothetical protein